MVNGLLMRARDPAAGRGKALGSFAGAARRGTKALTGLMGATVLPVDFASRFVPHVVSRTERVRNRKGYEVAGHGAAASDARIQFGLRVRVDVMIEILMSFALGFLASNLLILAVIPLVHSRAERLTVQRLEASIPVSIAEIHAGKDMLRAEFAVTTRRFEQTIEHLRSKMMADARELSRKTAIIAALQSGTDRTTANRGSWSPHSTGDESSSASVSLPDSNDLLAQKEAEIAKLTRELGERRRTSDAQRVEVVALKIRVEALNQQLVGVARQPDQAQTAVARRRDALRLAG